MPASTLSFGLLGPLVVKAAGREVRVGGPRQRCVLAQLLASANQPLSAERIADDLWEGDPPDGAAGTVRSYVSNLRTALLHASPGQPCLGTGRGGYLLTVAPDQLDAMEFEALCRRARALQQDDQQKALEVLDEALALWRGDALCEYQHLSFASADAARLNAARQAARATRGEILLALGEHREVVGDLAQLVAHYPLDETFQRQLMLALYRCGRQAEALRSYESCRRRLDEELGLRPSPALRLLAEAITRHDPSLQPPPAGPLPGTRTGRPGGDHGRASDPFVGRAELLGGLQRLVARLADPPSAGRHRPVGTLALLSGEAGSGKTRTVEELEQRLAGMGVPVCWGRCFDDHAMPPLWPWTRALLSALDQVPLAAGELARLAGPLADVARIAPEVGERLPGGGAAAAPDPPGTPTVADRFRLYSSLTSILRAVSGTRPTVVAIDDLHWADTPSLLFLRYLARDMPSTLMVVCTHRGPAVRQRPELADALSALAREPATHRFEMEELSVRDVARLIRDITDLDPEPYAAVIQSSAGGNCFFVRELVKLLHEQDHAGGTAPSPPWRIATSRPIAEVIGSQLDALSTEAGHLLSRAAVIGREFSIGLLAACIGQDRATLVDALEEAARSSLVVEDPGRPDTFRFRHDLVRQVAYERMSGLRRAHLHGDVALALSEPGPDGCRSVDRRAFHAHQAVRQGRAMPEAVEWLVDAGQRATDGLAFEQAATYFRQSLEIHDACGPADALRRGELLIALGESYWRLGDAEAAKATFLEAAASARPAPGRAHHPALFARAVLGLGGDRFANWPPHSLQASLSLIAHLEEAIAGIRGSEDALCARLTGRLARELGWLGRSDEADRLSAEAVALARRIPDRTVLADVFRYRCLAVSAPDHIDEREAAVEAVLDMGEDDGNRALTRFALHHRIWCHLERGQVDRARSAADAFTAFAAEMQWPIDRWLGKVLDGVFALLTGDWSRAEASAAEARRLGSTNQNATFANSIYESQMLCIHLERGDRAQLSSYADKLYQLAGTDAPHAAAPGDLDLIALNRQPTLCLVEARLGRHDRAAARLQWLAADGFARIPRNMLWLSHLTRLAEAASALGDVAVAGALFEVMSPFESQDVVLRWGASLGPVARVLGTLAATAGITGSAEHLIQRAIHLAERNGARPALAHSLWNMAELLRRDPSASKRHRSRELADRAVSMARSLGMTHLQGLIECSTA